MKNKVVFVLLHLSEFKRLLVD